MDHGHHHHHHLHHQYSAAAAGLNIDSSVSGGGSSDNRFPQWSIQETQDFLLIRAELDPAFMETKRNKLLWEVISTRMKEKGFNRSADQCKCKWKNLVTRYKGYETNQTMGAEGIIQQFPFYNELQAIFTARMQRMLWQEAESGGGSSRKKGTAAQFSSEEDEENDEIMSEGEKGPKKKRKATKTVTNATSSGNINTNNNNSTAIVNGIREMMEDLMRQQMQIESSWLRAYEKREEERRVKEMEWRQTMEALENERMMMERRWREREEQRKVRDEQRAEKRDALITALLNKLRREDG